MNMKQLKKPSLMCTYGDGKVGDVRFHKEDDTKKIGVIQVDRSFLPDSNDVPVHKCKCGK